MSRGNQPRVHGAGDLSLCFPKAFLNSDAYSCSGQAQHLGWALRTEAVSQFKKQTYAGCWRVGTCLLLSRSGNWRVERWAMKLHNLLRILIWLEEVGEAVSQQNPEALEEHRLLDSFIHNLSSLCLPSFLWLKTSIVLPDLSPWCSWLDY